MRYRLAKIEDIDDVCILINNAIRKMDSWVINRFDWMCLPKILLLKNYTEITDIRSEDMLIGEKGDLI